MPALTTPRWWLYPEIDQFNPLPPTQFLQDVFYILNQVLSPKQFMHLLYAMNATCLAHLTVLRLLLIISHILHSFQSQPSWCNCSNLTIYTLKHLVTALPSKLMCLFHVRTFNGTVPGDLQSNSKRTYRYVYNKVTSGTTKTWYVMNGYENSQS